MRIRLFRDSRDVFQVFGVREDVNNCCAELKEADHELIFPVFMIRVDVCGEDGWKSESRLQHTLTSPYTRHYTVLIYILVFLTLSFASSFPPSRSLSFASLPSFSLSPSLSRLPLIPHFLPPSLPRSLLHVITFSRFFALSLAVPWFFSHPPIQRNTLPAPPQFLPLYPSLTRSDAPLPKVLQNPRKR